MPSLTKEFCILGRFFGRLLFRSKFKLVNSNPKTGFGGARLQVKQMPTCSIDVQALGDFAGDLIFVLVSALRTLKVLATNRSLQIS